MGIDCRGAKQKRRRPSGLFLSIGVAGLLSAVGVLSAGAAPTLPEIRTSAHNPVPQCVTPERLMAFLTSRNPKLPARYKGLAGFYKTHGEAWHVRWDYAFFQMALETNFLTYRRPDGRMGDVDPKQNNFAGIGTTGGGVPGDSFPDIKTGVLGQIQHLVVYSGEMIPQPVAPRTQLKQEHILLKSRELNRPVRFSDLARRWAADPKYGSSIEWVAESFRSEYCRGSGPRQKEVLPWSDKPAAPRADAGEARPRESQTSASEVEYADPSEASQAGGDGSAVRTLWSRSEKKAAPPKASAKASKTPKIANGLPVVVRVPPKRSAEPQAVQPASSAPKEKGGGPIVEGSTLAETYQIAGAQVAATPDPLTPQSQPAEDSETPLRFAFFSPPALLADANSTKARFAPPSNLGFKPQRCIVEAASFGGTKAVLVRAPKGTDVHYIAVSVLEGFEKSMAESFIKARPQGGDTVGEFATRDEALAKARELCSRQ